MTKEVAYQTIGKGLSKVLKDAKKSTCPGFPVPCGTYALKNFKHSLVEIEQLKSFSFPTTLDIPYDPNVVAKDVTTQAKLKLFWRELENFDCLFEMVLEYYMVRKLVVDHLSPHDLMRFNQYRQSRLTHFQ